MLLKRHIDGYQPSMAWGQICLVVALLLLMLAGSTSAVPSLWSLLGGPAPTDFVQGFLDGLAGVLMGLSIALNVSGLMRYREERRKRAGRPESQQ